MKINTTDNVISLKGSYRRFTFYGATIKDGYVFMNPDERDVMYLYATGKVEANDVLRKHFSVDEILRFTTVTLGEEVNLLQCITEKHYTETLNKLDLHSYSLYRIELKHNTYKNKDVAKYRDESNSDKDTFYIVLRNDLGLSAGAQASYDSEITVAMASELFDTRRGVEFDRFIDLTKNTVVLQASAEDLFENNFIPAKYADPKVNFTYLWDDEKRVAHGNFRLVEGKTVAMGFFGVKKDLPKFLRKLALYGE